MFDLERQIRSWRTSIRDAVGNHPELLDELESHLRDDFERLVSAGQSAQQAWENASLQLGDPRTLGGEFAKLDARPCIPAWVATLSLTVIGALITCLAISRFRSGRISMLLAAHVVCVTVGYAGVFAVGFMALWAVVVHCVQGSNLRQDAAFRAAGARLALFAMIVTAGGIALGMAWSHNQFGRSWNWDPREIGALCVLAWSCVLAQSFRSRAPAPPLKQIAIMGNIVVCVSWFGPASVAGLHLHSYGSLLPGGIIGAFLLTQFLAIYFSLLPGGFLRLERLRLGRKT